MKSVIYIIILLSILGCANNEKLVSPAKFNGKYGYIETNGKWFIEPKFDSVGIFYNGYADFYSNGKSGLISPNGNIIIPAKYDFIGNVENDLALVEINDYYNFSDLKGNLISKSDFYDVGDFSENLVAVQYNEDGKWGYINNIGEKQIDTLYDYADTFENGNGLVDFGDLELLIDKNGKVIDTVVSPGLTYKNYRVTGNSDNGTLGKINLKGDTIMPNKYSSFGYVQKDKFWFKENSKFGIADTIGNILIKPLYEDLSYFSDNGLARAQKDGKYGFINEKGEVIIEFKFEDAGGFKYGLAKVKINNKWGFINEKGKLVIEPKFERIGHQFRPIKAKFESMYNYQLNY
jgi:hypothetical protein|tara:strand:+ start:45 stop:1085 length:1041 start_codon:yes stop_codon:yes gene_type:complete